MVSCHTKVPVSVLLCCFDHKKSNWQAGEAQCFDSKKSVFANAYSKHWNIVKLANSASPSKFCQVKIRQKTGLENDKMCLSER